MKLLGRIKGTSANNKIIIKNVFAAFSIKGAALLVSFLSAPAFIHYFNNNEILGVWFTLFSVLVWFMNFDLGIGNGIRNRLTRDLTNKDYLSARVTLSSGIVSITTVTLIILAVGLILLSTINLNWLFNVKEGVLSGRALRLSSYAVFGAIMLQFMLTYVRSTFYALQKSSVNNALALITSILQLLFVLVFHFDNADEALIHLSVWYLISANLPYIIAGIWVFCVPLKSCKPTFKAIEKSRINQIFGLGIVFFACQILYMFIVNTNELLITKLFGAAYTMEYSFYYRLNSIVGMLVTLSLTPVWSVVTKAVTEKDFIWLNKLYKAIQRASILVVISQFCFIPFLQPLFNIWLGHHVIQVNTATAISFAVFGSAFVISSMLSTIVCGMARMKLQFWCFLIGVLLKLVMDFTLYKVYPHWDLIVWSNVVVLLPYCIFQTIDLNRFFKAKIILSETTK